MFSSWQTGEVCIIMNSARHETLACVDELVCLKGRPFTEGLPTQLTHEVLYTCRQIDTWRRIQHKHWYDDISVSQSDNNDRTSFYLLTPFVNLITRTHMLWLTCVPLVMFQHVDLLGELAVTLFTFVLFDALMELHVVSQSVLGFHACMGKKKKKSTMWRQSKHQLPCVYCGVYANKSWYVCVICRGDNLTFPALCAQEISDVVVNPEVLFQHVLPREWFVALITAVALHPWMIT